MAAYVLADVNVKDPALFEEYRGKVGATIEKYGGRYIVRGGSTEVLEGEWQPRRVVVLEFPSLERAKEWYNSADYRPLIALRQRAADTQVVMVEGV